MTAYNCHLRPSVAPLNRILFCLNIHELNPNCDLNTTFYNTNDTHYVSQCPYWTAVYLLSHPLHHLIRNSIYSQYSTGRNQPKWYSASSSPQRSCSSYSRRTSSTGASSPRPHSQDRRAHKVRARVGPPTVACKGRRRCWASAPAWGPCLRAAPSAGTSCCCTPCGITILRRCHWTDLQEEDTNTMLVNSCFVLRIKISK